MIPLKESYLIKVIIMKQHKKYIKMNTKRKQIHITGQPPTFLALSTSELKYMFPWSQHDSTDELSVLSNNLKSLKNKKKRFKKVT